MPCIFCHKLVQINFAFKHLQTKKCLSMQSLDSDDRNKQLLEFRKRINEMRSDIRLNDEDAEEQDEHDDLLA